MTDESVEELGEVLRDRHIVRGLIRPVVRAEPMDVRGVGREGEFGGGRGREGDAPVEREVVGV